MLQKAAAFVCGERQFLSCQEDGNKMAVNLGGTNIHTLMKHILHYIKTHKPGIRISQILNEFKILYYWFKSYGHVKWQISNR